MFKKISRLSVWEKSLLFLLILIIGIYVFIGWVIFKLLTEKPPNFFPLNDSRAEYRITKDCPNGQGSVEQIYSQGYAYCLEYKGNKVLLKETENSNFFRVTVGKSKINLEQYLGKYQG
jgi:hypothetical protein